LAATILFLLLASVPLEGLGKRERALSRSGFSFLRLERASLPFGGLATIGILDSGTRTGFLTFLPFLLQGKGAGVRVLGLALSLIFGGGAAGKFVCGVLASRVGILRSVILTELGTAVCIYAMIGLPLKSVLLLCPLFGIVLNGTSSVLYGSVPELVPESCRKEAFAVFYTCTIGSGAIAPSIYGLVSDAVGIKACIAIVAAVVLLTIPLTIPLRGKLAA
jgi:predicted MFS family arabinose efflux permease